MLYGRDGLRPADVEKVKKLLMSASPLSISLQEMNPETVEHGAGAGGGNKRKASRGPKQPGASKKAKKEDPEEKAYQEQAKKKWAIIDDLKLAFSQKDLREILEENGASTRGGEDVLLSRVADGAWCWRWCTLMR